MPGDEAAQRGIILMHSFHSNSWIVAKARDIFYRNNRFRIRCTDLLYSLSYIPYQPVIQEIFDPQRLVTNVSVVVDSESIDPTNGGDVRYQRKCLGKFLSCPNRRNFEVLVRGPCWMLVGPDMKVMSDTVEGLLTELASTLTVSVNGHCLSRSCPHYDVQSSSAVLRI
ncbi:hypothetical protein MMC28_004833 [Mycoblastus sanguinarius]|nr:hypothetical protein [Mycoblastus sanguinarius]